MRSLLAGCLLALAVLAVSAGGAVTQDADDVALMELGINLGSASQVDPVPTYTTVKPAGHDAGTLARFPQLNEIKGIEAEDWKSIQGLLFREPPSAAESNLDMKLDELEQKFNKLDTKPVPSSIAPKGSTLLPSLHKEDIGLRATLPKAFQPKKTPRLQQVTAKAPKPVAPVAAKTTVPAAPLPAKHAAAAVAAAPAAPALAAHTTPLTSVVSAPTAKSAKSAQRVRDTVSTARLIEKRIRGLSKLFQRLKSQIGMHSGPTPTSMQRVQHALSKHRKDAKHLRDRMAARAGRKARFAQVGMDAEADAEAEAQVAAELEGEPEAAHSFAETESESETDADVDAEAEAESEVDVDAVLDAEADSETEAESEVDAEAELALDAEAVDSILDSLL